MDIESKRYRARSIIFGDVQLIDKTTRQSVTIPTSHLPGVHSLAMMKEADFDREIAKHF